MPLEFTLLIPFLLFPLCALLALRLFRGSLRNSAFALVNVMGAFGLAFATLGGGRPWWLWRDVLTATAWAFALYLVWVLAHYYLLRQAERHAALSAFTLLFPILMLAVFKYVPAVSAPVRDAVRHLPKASAGEAFVGLSYLSFRLSYFAMEVRNQLVAFPSLADYLSYVFFVPTLSIGPISSYRTFSHSFQTPSRQVTPIGRSLLRMMVGLTKYLFIASLLQQLSYGGLLRDEHLHPWVDLPVAAVAFYLYLYLNFSGYCDLAIGGAGLLGIQVQENFDRPFSSRNIQEFWNRWHITLSTFLREMVFSPLSKFLIEKFGLAFAPHAIGISIFLVFALMGVWHGLALNFLIYGCLHGLAVVSCHYYTIFLKKRLGKKGYAAYMANPWIRLASTSLTFCFVVVTLFFFANSSAQIRGLLQILR